MVSIAYSVCGWSLTLLIGWITLLVIYRLYLHPLAKYPGPIFAKITDFYNVYHCFMGDRHLEFHRIHMRYGGIVRYGPNRISFNTESALQSIYGRGANVRKSSHFRVFRQFFPAWSTQTIIDTERYNHPIRRKVLGKGLGDTALRNLQSDISTLIDDFCSMLLHEPSTQEWSAPKDMARIASYLSFDIMGKVCFGQDLGMLRSEDNHYIIDVASFGARCLNTVGHMQSWLIVGLHKLLFQRLLRDLQSYKSYSAALGEISKEEETKDSIFGHLFRARHPGTGRRLLTDAELLSESSLLIVAGSDTTSTCIAATLFYLLRDDGVYDRVQREIRTNFARDCDIRLGSQLSSCRYLRACIDESLRMSPPVGGLMPREVLAGGVKIEGHFFPEGTELGVPHYAIHHNTAYYCEPFTYNPDRWLSVDYPEPRRTFLAWSTGPRECIGKGMAYMEITMVLGRLLWQFDMRLDEERSPSEVEYRLWDTFASQSSGPMVEFRRRRDIKNTEDQSEVSIITRRTSLHQL